MTNRSTSLRNQTSSQKILSLLITYAKHLIQSRFVRNIATVATGTAAAQAITMAFAPIITRLYSPEALGVLGTFTAILTVITPLAALSYPIAVVLPKNDSDAIGLAKVSLGISLGTSLLVALITITFKVPIVKIFNLQAVENYIYLLPLTMLFSACLAVASQWVIRKKLFNLKAKVAVLHSFILNFAKLGMGAFHPVAAMLVILAAFAGLLHALMLWLGIRKEGGGAKLSVKPSSGIRALLSSYKDFAIFRTPQIFLNSISQNLPLLLLAVFFGPVAAGFYTLSRTVLGLPSALIGQSVSDVFYPKFVEKVHAGNGRVLLIKTCAALASIGMVPYLIIFAFGPMLFSLVFGHEWYEAGEYARWMSLWLFMVLMTRPIISAIPVLAIQGSFLMFEAVALLIRAAAILAGYFLFDSSLAAVIAFSISNVILYAVLFGYVVHKS